MERRGFFGAVAALLGAGRVSAAPPRPSPSRWQTHRYLGSGRWERLAEGAYLQRGELGSFFPQTVSLKDPAESERVFAACPGPTNSRSYRLPPGPPLQVPDGYRFHSFVVLDQSDAGEISFPRDRRELIEEVHSWMKERLPTFAIHAHIRHVRDDLPEFADDCFDSTWSGCEWGPWRNDIGGSRVSDTVQGTVLELHPWVKDRFRLMLWTHRGRLALKCRAACPKPEILAASWGMTLAEFPASLHHGS